MANRPWVADFTPLVCSSVASRYLIQGYKPHQQPNHAWEGLKHSLPPWEGLYKPQNHTVAPYTCLLGLANVSHWLFQALSAPRVPSCLASRFVLPGFWVDADYRHLVSELRLLWSPPLGPLRGFRCLIEPNQFAWSDRWGWALQKKFPCHTNPRSVCNTNQRSLSCCGASIPQIDRVGFVPVEVGFAESYPIALICRLALACVRHHCRAPWIPARPFLPPHGPCFAPPPPPAPQRQVLRP